MTSAESTAGDDASVLSASDVAAGSARLFRLVRADLCWAFTRPWGWMSGVAFNLLLSLLYLVVVPFTGQPHRNWAILVGSYFAVFILADVTTTNVLGADAVRVRQSLVRSMPLWRILATKNLTLLLVVALPTLIATAFITVDTETTPQLALTLPGVLFPVLVWLGVGNLVSVALPVAALPLRVRWERRHELRSTVRWSFALVLPNALCYLIDPMSKLPVLVIHGLGTLLGRSVEVRGSVILALGLVLYGVGTALALVLARVRGSRLDAALIAL